MVWVLSVAMAPWRGGQKEFVKVGIRKRTLDKPYGVLDTAPEGKMNRECLK